MSSPELEIDAAALARRLAGGDVYLLDVRQPWEHELVHLPGDVLVPLPELPRRLDDVRPAAGQIVVCYCHHGVRSLSAAALLRQAGVPALSLAGGIDHWSRALDPSLPRY